MWRGKKIHFVSNEKKKIFYIRTVLIQKYVYVKQIHKRIPFKREKKNETILEAIIRSFVI